MNTIQPITEQHIDSMLNLIKNAYTGFDYHLPQNGEMFKERISRIIKEDPTVNFWGYFKEGKMIGCMRLHDYTMNLHSTKLFAGGIGLVAVDLLHKKEKIADLLEENSQSVITQIKDGYLKVAESDRCDIEVSLGMSDFSSLLKYGLATVSKEEFTRSLNTLFNGQKPMCMSGF